MYAFNLACPEHAKARAFLNEAWTDRDFVVCELSLSELYGLLRNPVLWPRPYSASDAVTLFHTLRSNPHWELVDYPGGLMDRVWRLAGEPEFARRAIFDARLSLTLRHHRVEEFATRNVNHFVGYSFSKVWNPLED